MLTNNLKELINEVKEEKKEGGHKKIRKLVSRKVV
jgi:hypothetical protein